MDIQTSKIELVKLILDTNNQALIDKVYSIFSESKNQKSEFTQDQIDEIQLGLEQLEKGQGISFKDYLKRFPSMEIILSPLAEKKLDHLEKEKSLKPNLKDAFILNDVEGSDHCPVGLELEV